MRYLSVCSGIEAATSAWHPLGWDSIGFSEIDKFPAAVLAHHYPDVKNLGDMTKHKEWNIEQPDVIVGGTPCQSFSVAGLRKGMADPRGNLALVYLAIIDQFRPKWLVWENVPGVLSSNGGRDFGSILGGMGKLGYGFAYRVLDAQHVRTQSHSRAVPQRRRRVFVVGHLGSWQRAAAVLFERESLSGNPPPGRKKGEEVAGTFTSRANSGGWSTNVDLAASGYMRPEVVGGLIHAPAVSPAMKARDCKGVSSDGDGDGIPILAFQSKASASQSMNPSNVAPCLDVGKSDGIAVAFTQNTRDEVRLIGGDGSIAGAQAAEQGMKQQTYIAYGISENPDVGHCLRSGASRADKHESTTYIQTLMQVRRLTPVECERLMGFPDNYTRIPWRNKPAEQCPDGPRYKALGNSMAVNVMRWIGDRIQSVDQIVRARAYE